MPAMEWWQWIVLSAVLLSAEAFVDADFYLIFLGVAAALVGLLALTPLDLPLWGQVLLFAFLAVSSLVLFRRRVYAKLRPPLPDRPEGVVGEVVVTNEAIDSGRQGRVTLRGSSWTAVNAGETSLDAHARARVMSVEGLTLTVWPED